MGQLEVFARWDDVFHGARSRALELFGQACEEAGIPTPRVIILPVLHGEQFKPGCRIWIAGRTDDQGLIRRLARAAVQQAVNETAGEEYLGPDFDESFIRKFGGPDVLELLVENPDD